MTNVTKYLRLEASLFPLRVLALDGVNLLATENSHSADVHLFCMKLEVNLHFAVCILFLELVKGFLNLYLALKPENVGNLSAGSFFLEVKLNENFTLNYVIELTKITFALDTLLLFFFCRSLVFFICLCLHSWRLHVDGLLEILGVSGRHQICNWSLEILSEVWNQWRYYVFNCLLNHYRLRRYNRLHINSGNCRYWDLYRHFCRDCKLRRLSYRSNKWQNLWLRYRNRLLRNHLLRRF